MKTESLVRIVAGTMVLVSTALIYFVSPWWLLLNVFIGVNLIQSAFTGFCPPEILFKKLGIAKDGGSCCNQSDKKES
jgi:hypothetical protein